MYQNNLFTGTKLLERVQKVAHQKYGTVYENIGLVTVHADKQDRPYFILNDNRMDKIGTVTRREIKKYMKADRID
jgi:hypothetical protein